MENKISADQKIRLKDLGYIDSDPAIISKAIVWLSQEFNLPLGNGTISLVAMNDVAESALLDVLIDQAKSKQDTIIDSSVIDNDSVLPLIHSMDELTKKNKGLYNASVFSTDMPVEVESTWMKYLESQVDYNEQKYGYLNVYSRETTKLIHFIEYLAVDRIITFNPKFNIEDGTIKVTSTNWDHLSNLSEFDYKKMLITVRNEVSRQLDYDPRFEVITFLVSSEQYCLLTRYVMFKYQYVYDDNTVGNIFINYNINIQLDRSLK